MPRLAERNKLGGGYRRVSRDVGDMPPFRRAIEDQQRADADAAALGRLALTKCEAAETPGVSVDFLERHVMDDLRVVRRGRRRLIPVRELERWLELNALRALDNDRRPG